MLSIAFRFFAIPVSPQIGRDHLVPGGHQLGRDPAPDDVGLWMAMEQQHRRAFASAGIVYVDVRQRAGLESEPFQETGWGHLTRFRNRVGNRGAAGLRVRRPAEVGCPQCLLGQHALNRSDDGLTGLFRAQMI